MKSVRVELDHEISIGLLSPDDVFEYRASDAPESTYERGRIASSPRPIQAWSDATRALLEELAIRLPVHFQRLERLQPADFVESRTWRDDDYYSLLTGRRRNPPHVPPYEVDVTGDFRPILEGPRPDWTAFLEERPLPWLARDDQGAVAWMDGTAGDIVPVDVDPLLAPNVLRALGAASASTQELARLGLFVFENAGEAGWSLVGAPEAAFPIDRLDPELRRSIAATPVVALSFARGGDVQPADRVSCDSAALDAFSSAIDGRRYVLATSGAPLAERTRLAALPEAVEGEYEAALARYEAKYARPAAAATAHAGSDQSTASAPKESRFKLAPILGVAGLVVLAIMATRGMAPEPRREATTVSIAHPPSAGTVLHAWFATDLNGALAVFDPAEGGGVPASFMPSTSEGIETQLAVARWRAVAQSLPPVPGESSASASGLRAETLALRARASAAGWFVYAFSSKSGRYERVHRPGDPARVTDVSDDLRPLLRLTAVSLPTVFAAASASSVDPCEKVTCRR